LISIPSSNPHISDKDEKKIASYLKNRLENSGLDVTLQPVTSEPYYDFQKGKRQTRPNVIARTGRSNGIKIILNGHIDTVSGDSMNNAFKPQVKGDRLYGRGSADMKGGVAAIIAATEAILESNSCLNGELVLSLVVDEETSGLGTQEFLKNEGVADFAVVAEPTDNTLGVAQAGYLDFNIYSRGHSRHGQTALPSLWSSAFVQATNLCNRIITDKEIIRKRRYNGFDMETTANFSPTKYTAPLSGAWMTMDEFRVNCLLGLIPERTITESMKAGQRIVGRIRKLLNDLNSQGQRNTLELVDLKPGFIQTSNTYTRAFEEAMRVVRRDRQHSYVYSFCDATYFYRAGIPTILFGPGRMELGHTTMEHTSIRAVKDATSVFAHAIDNILRKPIRKA
jgi:acetylornithine deacetylase/succinyl-diaminopimelate desuccinylase-like protein